MAPSPRKRAAPTAPTTMFNTTWNEADAAYLDPSTLPVAKIPRAWERKPEVKRIGQGKEKKIWRRFNLRSRADTTQDDTDDDEQDARSRPVKRLQQMSPKAMEKTKLGGKKRAFKATRWDRRKSVLPRKRAVGFSESAELGDDEGDSCDITEGDSASFNDLDETMQGQDEVEGAPADAPNFTFSPVSKHESLEPQDMEDIDSRPAEDATLANLFRSPVKPAATSPAKVDYPELPGAHEEGESETIEETTEQTEETANKSEVETENIETEDAEIQYPTLPLDVKSPSPSRETHSSEPDIKDADKDDKSNSTEAQDSDEEFTEASLQLDILRDYQKSLQPTPTAGENDKIEEVEQPQVAEIVSENPTDDEVATETPVETELVDTNAETTQDHDMTEAPEDITDGLVLSLTPTKSTSTPRKLHSPPPPLATGTEDTAMTISFDDDTAMLKDFLNRAAASKAEKAALSTHRRESLQNRRDSDVIRHALASPRKALEEKDPNSPSKHTTELTLELSQALTLPAPSETLSSPTPEATEPETTEEANKGTRRSSRAKKSRLPAPASVGPAPAPKIAIRRNDGNEVVVLKKDDAKVLADLTRANTRKNKQGAFCVTVRLMKAQMDAISLPPIDDSTKEIVVGKNVRWDEQLAYYQENPDTVANALAEAESLATPDELGFSDSGSEPKKKKTSKTSTPKVRRVKGLGTANGTPAKGLTAPASLLPEAVQQEKESKESKKEKPATSQPKQQQEIPKPKVAKAKKMPVASTTESTASPKLSSFDIAPVGISSSASAPAQRKSRLAAPRKVVLPSASSTTSTTLGDGKENSTSLRTGFGLGLGLNDATPKKGIPVPKVVIPASTTSTSSTPTLTGESGLPRRRGRKY